MRILTALIPFIYTGDGFKSSVSRYSMDQYAPQPVSSPLIAILVKSPPYPPLSKFHMALDDFARCRSGHPLLLVSGRAVQILTFPHRSLDAYDVRLCRYINANNDGCLCASRDTGH